MWIWYSKAGELYHDAVFEGAGYSGLGEGKNNPAWDHIKGVGPIPAGRWFIGPAEPHAHLAPPVMRLTPAPETQTWDRTGLLIHGDKIVDPGTASHGCIILGRILRVALDASSDKILDVVPGSP